jgi:acetyl esterase/lipase
VIPSTGLSLHKPSPLWPPPSDDIRSSGHTGKSVVEALSHPDDQENVVPKSLPRSATSLPRPKVLDANKSFVLRAENGEVVEVAQQVQLYAPNGLLKHPLVSPVLSYLGGLPPLFFIAGDKEVLRDEIIYTYVIFLPCFLS